MADLDRLAEGARRGRGQQGTAPEAGVVDPDRAQRPHRGNQREAERQGQRGVQADDHQRLAQVLARPALGIECGVGDSQDFGRHRRVAADRLGDFGHLDVRIAGERDDFRRHTRRAGEVDLGLQAVFEVLRLHLAAVIGWSGGDLSLIVNLLLTVNILVTRIPGSYVRGGVPKRPTGADCKSAGLCLRRFESYPLHHLCGCSSMVEPQPSKLMVWVRFPSPAPLLRRKEVDSWDGDVEGRVSWF